MRPSRKRVQHQIAVRLRDLHVAQREHELNYPADSERGIGNTEGMISGLYLAASMLDGDYVDPERYACAHEGCLRRFENHKWAKIKAHASGWFFESEGRVWCPKHKPDWVEEWRKRKQAKERGDG